MNAYRIKLKVFEGPLDLLMHLIEKDKINIYDIPIASITEQYMDYLRTLKEFNMEIASEFLIMAATLLQIKSRLLLPKVAVENNLDDEELDPRQELVDRLLEYRKFKQAALLMEQMLNERESFFTRIPQNFDKQYLLPQNMNVDELIRAFAAVWESKAENFALVDHEEVTVQDKMYDIIHLLYKNRKLEFTQCLTRNRNRSEVVSTFLALLELIKLRKIIILQERKFGPIDLVLRE